MLTTVTTPTFETLTVIVLLPAPVSTIPLCPQNPTIESNPLTAKLFVPPKPSIPCVKRIPMLAKYVKLFNHSDLAPLVNVTPSAFGTMNVTAWNNIAASLLSTCTAEPSTSAPRPASPELNPIVSLNRAMPPSTFDMYTDSASPPSKIASYISDKSPPSMIGRESDNVPVLSTVTF